MSSPSPPGAIRQLWFKWKTLRLPWRKKWLVGADLSGNTFWEFKDALNANRLRRIVHYNPKAHYADVKIAPQWHQWLRHTRPDAPSIQEQQLDVTRQIRMRQLAAEADARWNSVPSFLDSPDKQQAVPAIGVVKDAGGYVQDGNQIEPGAAGEGVINAVVSDASPPQHQHQQQEQDVQGSTAEDKKTVAAAAATEGSSASKGKTKTKTKKANPWKQAARGAPGEDWQPQSWTPGVARKR